MSYQLDDLLKDNSLQRLFLTEEKACALQLWILQIEKNNIIENRLIYGRLVPYNFSNNSWSFSDKNNYKKIDDFRVHISQLNLYIDNSLCSDLIRLICEGKSLKEISHNLGLNITPRLNEKYGHTILIKHDPIFQPVAYLMNRTSNSENLLLSPHESACALSSAISIPNKTSLFLLDESYSRELISIILNRLEEDLGNVDFNRLSEIELLVFPTLDDNENDLLTIENNKHTNEFSIQFISKQVPIFTKFQFQLTCKNNNYAIYSKIVSANSTENNIFKSSFQLSDKIFKVIDSARVDIFGFIENDSGEGTLCCSYECSFIRRVDLTMYIAGHNSNSVKFDWLEKTVKSGKKSDRLAAVLSSSFESDMSKNSIGDKVDPWVEENHKLTSILQKLNPPQSNGRFFLKNSQDNGEGKLSLVEWFKALLKKHENENITIFDPYFESVGLELLNLYASPKAKYSIFRTLPKTADTNTGVENLVAHCEKNAKKIQYNNITIYGLKDGRLHDRYILIMDPDGLPIEGYHLSNSFQKATENYPLLVTPIPVDTLYEIYQYSYDIVNKNSENSPSNISIIFPLKTRSPNTKKDENVYKPLSFLNNEFAGKVFSIWVGNPALKELLGDDLLQKMQQLKIIQNESFHDLPSEGLFHCLTEMNGELVEFTKAWTVIAEILARKNNDCLKDLQFQNNFLNFLSTFLSKSFQRKHNDTEILVENENYLNLKDTLLELITSSIKVFNFSRGIKSNILNWAEYYAIKCLWWYQPENLISIIEQELILESESINIVKLSLVEQALREISTSVECNVLEKEQLDSLLESNIPLLKWLGWNGIASFNDQVINTSLSKFPYCEKLQFIAWSLNKNLTKNKCLCSHEGLIKELFNIFPEKIPHKDLVHFITVAKGHMHKLLWSGQWLFDDIIQPLLDNKRICFDDAYKIWLDEFTEILQLNGLNQLSNFSLDRQGNFINITARLLANSSSSSRVNSLNKIKKILSKQKQIIQQPLASTSNEIRWENALKISAWIFAFIKLCKYYLDELGIEDEEINSLLNISYEIFIVRPLEEWKCEIELIQFIENIESS